MVYPCPSCSKTFLKPRAVFRHLNIDHRKSMRRIRLMRDSILRRKIKASDVQIKGPSKEVSRLQIDENVPWKDNTENSNLCSYCGKSFERKAVLTTHLMNCQMKNKSNHSDILKRNNDSTIETFIKIKPKDELEEDCIHMERPLVSATIDLITDEQLVNKRKRRRTMKVPKEKTDTVIDETLMERFVKLDCSDDQNGTSTVSVDENKAKDKPKRTSLDDVQNDDNKAKDSIKSDEIKPKKVEIASEGRPKRKRDNSSQRQHSQTKNTPEMHSKKMETIQTELKKIRKELKMNDSQQKSDEQKTETNSKQSLSYFCRICERKFTILSNLRRHISTFHYPSRKYECKICKKFTDHKKSEIINHLNVSHSIVEDKNLIFQHIIVHEEVKNVEEKKECILIKSDECTEKESKKRIKSVNASPKVKVQNGGDVKTVAKKSEAKVNGTSEPMEKRPRRKRTKAVDKDFVYDLSSILKNDNNPLATEASLASNFRVKKRNSSSLEENKSNEENIENFITQDLLKSIKNSAQAMAQLAVSSFRASLAFPPELPAVRPAIPRIIIPVATPNSGAIIYESDVDEGKSKDNPKSRQRLRKSPKESFFDVLPKRKRLNQKVKMSFQNGSSFKAEQSPVEESSNSLYRKKFCDTKKYKSSTPMLGKSLKEILLAKDNNGQSDKPLPNLRSLTDLAVTSPPPSTKRISLMQRLAENRKKKNQESLLRTVLEK